MLNWIRVVLSALVFRAVRGLNDLAAESKHRHSSTMKPSAGFLNFAAGKKRGRQSGYSGRVMVVRI